jgi:hypothetical protein
MIFASSQVTCSDYADVDRVGEFRNIVGRGWRGLSRCVYEEAELRLKRSSRSELWYSEKYGWIAPDPQEGREQ